MAGAESSISLILFMPLRIRVVMNSARCTGLVHSQPASVCHASIFNENPHSTPPTVVWWLSIKLRTRRKDSPFK
ncbi:MAG: hypothetical protein VCD31_14725, partial [Alphaproteobacteria bacterium]